MKTPQAPRAAPIRVLPRPGRRRFTAALGALVMVTLASATASSDQAQKPVVLHIGDSFTAAGLAQALRPKFEARGRSYKVHYKTSAYTTTLPKDIGLADLVAQYRPALTIVTLGANEIPLTDPSSRRAAIKRVVEHATKFGDCVWTLPPVWREDGNEILEVIRAEAAPCKVYDPSSIAKEIARKRDKIHPSPEGGARWAEGLWSWLEANQPKAIESTSTK